MKKYFLPDYIRFADLHAQRLTMVLNALSSKIPITGAYLKDLKTVNEIAPLDMAISRFSALQDMIGSKIFPLILEKLEEDDKAFIDKLNKLEKIEYIESANWWTDLRDLRNQLSHDYHDDYDVIAKDFNQLVKEAHELLIFWDEFKKKIAPLITVKSEEE